VVAVNAEGVGFVDSSADDSVQVYFRQQRGSGGIKEQDGTGTVNVGRVWGRTSLR